MADKSMFAQLYNAIIAGDKNGLGQAVEDALKEGIVPSDVIEKGMSPGMKEVGDRFARYEIYLPEMMMAAEAWEGAMKILEPKLLESGSERKKVGRVVVGTVKGDIHSIGKNIVGAMLKMNGFEVIDLGVTSTRDTIWARSVANQAITRNSTLPVVNVGYSAAGPMTRMLFYEHCAWVIASVVSGGSVEVGASARGTALDYTSPVEPLLASEVAHAVAGMSRREANDVVNSLLGKYENQLREPPAGQKYQECCDPVTGRPSHEFLELYLDVRREMADQFGIQFSSASPYL